MAARTLVISDLHLGANDGCSVLSRPAALELLLAELEDCERLVLLGDVVELLEAEATTALPAAAPTLRAIGARVARAGGEIVYVPGNHDRALVAGWIAAQGSSLELEATVPADASAALRELLAQLAPARVEVRYPAVWLSERVWAHHGHYLNRYLVPGQTYGLMPRQGRMPQAGGTRPSQFEPRRRGAVRSLVRLLPRRAAAGIEDVGELVRAATMPGARASYEVPAELRSRLTTRLHERLLHPRFSPMVSHLLGLQVRRHSLPAVARVAHVLGVEPEYLLFGHVHRRGPMEGDELGEWELGGARIFNTGAWRWEPVLVARARPPHPYWPGGAVVVGEDGVPRSAGLLDSLGRDELEERNR